MLWSLKFPKYVHCNCAVKPCSHCLVDNGSMGGRIVSQLCRFIFLFDLFIYWTNKNYDSVAEGQNKMYFTSNMDKLSNEHTQIKRWVTLGQIGRTIYQILRLYQGEIIHLVIQHFSDNSEDWSGRGKFRNIRT